MIIFIRMNNLEINILEIQITSDVFAIFLQFYYFSIWHFLSANFEWKLLISYNIVHLELKFFENSQ